MESSNCLPFRSTCVHINNTAPLVEISKYLPFRSTCVHINNTTPLVESSNCLPFRSTCVHINLLVVGFMLLNLRFMCSDRVDHCLFFLFRSLHCLSVNLRLLIAPLVSSNSFPFCLFRPLYCLVQFTASDYSFSIFKLFPVLPV